MAQQQHFHFVGIGGIGMSGMAAVLHQQGCKVTGSDVKHGPHTDRLAHLGIQVLKHDPENIKKGIHQVVVSSAIPKDHVEITAALQQGIPVIQRAEMLAKLLESTEKRIAVAGTHGKTTTTSLITSILLEASRVDPKWSPTFFIGGYLNRTGENARWGGHHQIAVAETDESDGSFLRLMVLIAVITNIDRDHMSTYHHNFDKLKEAFVTFAKQSSADGFVLACVDDPVVSRLMPELPARTRGYGFSEQAEFRALGLRSDSKGRTCFGVRRPEHSRELEIVLNLPGEHNVRNALAAIAAATILGVPDQAIQRALASFAGVGRRFQRHGEIQLPRGGICTVVDDYAHHPVEVQATLSAARQVFPDRRLVLVFQPHRFSRTRDCFDGFAQILAQADLLCLLDVFCAGEPQLENFDSAALEAAVRQVQEQYGHSGTVANGDRRLEMQTERLAAHLQDRDVVITMGAGSIASLPEQLKQWSARQTRP